MSVEFEEKVLSKLDYLEKRSDEFVTRFDSLEKRTDALEEKMLEGFDSIKCEIAAVEEEMQLNSDEINGKIKKMDERIQEMNGILIERFDLPKLSDRMDVMEYVVGKHTDQINQLNKKTGINSVTA